MPIQYSERKTAPSAGCVDHGLKTDSRCGWWAINFGRSRPQCHSNCQPWSKEMPEVHVGHKLARDMLNLMHESCLTSSLTSREVFDQITAPQGTGWHSPSRVPILRHRDEGSTRFTTVPTLPNSPKPASGFLLKDPTVASFSKTTQTAKFSPKRADGTMQLVPLPGKPRP